VRIAIGLLLMAAALGGCFFFAAVGAGLAGANPSLTGPLFLMFWGFGGPFFFLGLALVAGGPDMSGTVPKVCLALGAASIGLAFLAARSL
jgi:hypothetical protein